MGNRILTAAILFLALKACRKEEANFNEAPSPLPENLALTWRSSEELYMPIGTSLSADSETIP